MKREPRRAAGIGAALLIISIMLVPASLHAQDNLVQSPDPLLDDGRPAPGWTLHADASPAPEPEHIREGMASVPVPPAKYRKLAQTVAAPPGSELFFSAEVRSDGKLIATIGEVRLSYHRQGQWQTLAGFVRVPEAGTLDISFFSSGLEARSPATLEIRNVTVRPFQRPGRLERRAVSNGTPLVAGGAARVTVVYPSAAPEFRELAQRIGQRIRNATGVEVPLVSDTDATQADVPALRDEFRDRHLILIGRLGINRAMWTAYGRWLDATDGYYPGGDGYVVRTAVDVLGNGRNHVILGGSSDAGVGRAVERFLAHLDKATADPKTGDLTLPFVLDVELGGECLTAFRKHDAAWNDPADKSVPPVEPGYGTVRRWYENAMGWYWSGWDSYRARTGDTLGAVLSDRAYTHHYIFEFLVRTYDMVDETGVMSPEQREQMQSLIVDNFLTFGTGAGDAGWMTTFSPPYESIEIVNRHQISPWVADFAVARFLNRTLEPSSGGDLSAVARFRESEKLAFFQHVLSERWESSLPGGLDETQEEFAMAMTRLSLELEQFQFFSNGHARRTLSLEKLSHLTGNWVRPGGSADTRLILNTLASYHRDGRYLALARKLPTAAHFMNRTVNGVHRFTPGPELAEQDPADLAGTRLSPLMPHRLAQLPSLRARKFAPISFDPADVFDFVSFRSGFGRTDDFVTINGLVGQGIPGTFLSFASHGVQWLPGGGKSSLAGGADSYFQHNAVHILRTDQWPRQPDPYTAAARLDWQGGWRQRGGVAFTLDPHAGARWQRAVVWLAPGLYIVRDRVTTDDAGDYQVAIHWRPAGTPQWADNAWLSRSGEAQLRLIPLGKALAITSDLAADRPAVRMAASRTLDAGQSLTGYTVLHVSAAADTPIAAREIPQGVYLSHPTDRSLDRAVLFKPQQGGTLLRSDGESVVVARDGVTVYAATTLELAGQSLLRCDAPVSLHLGWDGTQWVVEHTPGSDKATIHLPADASALGRVLDELAAMQTVAAAQGPASKPAVSAPKDERWKQTWSFGGLRQPMPVSPAAVSIRDGVLDLGREVVIGEIRPKRPGGPWRTVRLPDDLRYAVAGPDGHAPPADSPLWKRFEPPPRTVPGIDSGNYGKAVPVAEDHDVLHPLGVRARFIRSSQIAGLIVCDAEAGGREVPLAVQVSDLDGDLQPEILVHTNAWPNFIRKTHYVQDTVAALTADGRQLFRNDYDLRVQSVDLLNLGEPVRTLAVSTQDGLIRLLKPDGSTARELDLFQMHQRFQLDHGRGNTRQPAGGFTLPFAVGPWRTSAGSPPGFVVGRYHSFSFIGPDGRFEGLLSQGSYVQPAMLGQGIDFDGDGAEEQVCLGRGVLWRLRGPLDRRIEEPNGQKFYPQVYHADPLPEPAWEDHINGSRPILLTGLKAGAGSEERARHVLAARENYLAIYDGAAHGWSFSWVPLVPIRSAAIITDSAETLAVAVVTDDDLLWRITFDRRLDRVVDFTVTPLAVDVHDVSPLADGAGLLLAGNDGLYVCEDGVTLRQVAAGSFVQARSIRSTSDNRAGGIVAVTADASIVRFDR